MLRPGLAHIREVLESNRLIRRHLEQRDRELALFGMVSDRLPDALRRHCRDATLADGVLTLYVDSPAWSTRARFAMDELARSLRKEGVVKVVTQVRLEPVGAAMPKPMGQSQEEGAANGEVGAKLSSHAITHILSAADGLSDPVLADLLRRLAERHSGNGRGEEKHPADAGMAPDHGMDD
jgi:hypothetical protein